MHPYLAQMLARARMRDVTGARPPHERAVAPSGPEVLIRRSGTVLVAEVNGRVAAALPLDGTAPAGDAALLQLLELRAGQLAA